MPESTSKTRSPSGCEERGHEVERPWHPWARERRLSRIRGPAARERSRPARPSAGSRSAGRASAFRSPSTANPACRCARVDDPLSAQLAREHNDANVLALGGRLIGSDMAKACVARFSRHRFRWRPPPAPGRPLVQRIAGFRLMASAAELDARPRTITPSPWLLHRGPRRTGPRGRSRRSRPNCTASRRRSS